MTSSTPSAEPYSLAQRVYWRVVPEPVRRFIRPPAGDASRARQARILADPRSRKRVPRIESLRGSRSGRCFILGNGPSLNDMNLEVLRGEQIWMVNKGYLLLDRVSWSPSHYVMFDRLGAEDHGGDYDRLTRDLPDTTFLMPHEHFVHGRLRTTAPNVYWLPTVPVDMALPEPALPDGTITSLPTVGVAVTYTVTVSAIQLAAFLGFDPIYLIGCDMSYDVPSASVLEVDERSGLQTLQELGTADVNHFAGNYHQPGDRWYLPRPDLMVLSYELVAARCRELGVEVCNATAGGRLEVFPRCRFEDLFENGDR